MRKKQASLLAILATIAIALLYEFGAIPEELMGEIVAEEKTGTTVVRVVDGDTIIVHAEGEDRTVRIIGVNTPETVDPRKPVECFGKEASQALKEKLLVGDEVTLIADPSQTEEDRYGRWLRYVEKNNEDIGTWLIESGYAQEYTYKVPYEKQGEYAAAEEEARTQERGLWGDTCSSEKK